MININEWIEYELKNGYNDTNARAKICQDIILKAIACSSLNRNITVKGGVVMRSKTTNVRRATLDLDLDFIKYPLKDESIDNFIKIINCIDGVTISRVGMIEDLKQQDYHGKRIYVTITDNAGITVSTKLDLGVHNKFDIEQEDYCFDVAKDSEGVSLLINSPEQMIIEKLRSLLKFGPISTRYKDIFDLYYLSHNANRDKLILYLRTYIFNDTDMREKDIEGVINRVKKTFNDKTFRTMLGTTNFNWLDIDVDEMFDYIISFLHDLK